MSRLLLAVLAAALTGCGGDEPQPEPAAPVEATAPAAPVLPGMRAIDRARDAAAAADARTLRHDTIR